LSARGGEKGRPKKIKAPGAPAKKAEYTAGFIIS